MDKNQLSIIEKTIQYKFNNDALLVQAFDFEPGNGNDPRSNGILRIVGKRAINYALTVVLTSYYGKNVPGKPYKTTIENTVIYDLLDNLTSQDLYKVSVNVLGLTEYVVSYSGGELVDMDRKLFEAIVGAVALDSNWNISIIANVVSFMLDVDYWLNYGFANIDSHPTILLFNYCVETGQNMPSYVYKRVKDANGNIFIKCELTLGNLEFIGMGGNHSEARLLAAQEAYKYLTENNMTSQIVKDAGDYSEANAMDTLDNLTLKGYFSFPDYHTDEINGGYVSTCMIDEIDKKFKAFDKEKKNAKNKAAYRMLLYVLGKEVPADEADNIED